jgi:hypothetical protein
MRDRRLDQRVGGPFPGKRLGLLDMPVRICNLGLGGCFVESSHDAIAGEEIVLEADLPRENTLVLTGIIPSRPQDVGFGVRFVDLPEETREALRRVVSRCLRPKTRRAI